MSEEQFDANKYINDQIKSHLTTLNPSIREAVIREVVNNELEHRQHMLKGAVAAVSRYNRLLSDIKPEVAGFDSSGVVQSGLFFTYEQTVERESLTRLIEKLKAAINAAVTDADWTLMEDSHRKANGIGG